jgi:hypothetical protein
MILPAHMRQTDLLETGIDGDSVSIMASGEKPASLRGSSQHHQAA